MEHRRQRGHGIFDISNNEVSALPGTTDSMSLVVKLQQEIAILQRDVSSIGLERDALKLRKTMYKSTLLEREAYIQSFEIRLRGAQQGPWIEMDELIKRRFPSRATRCRTWIYIRSSLTFLLDSSAVGRTVACCPYVRLDTRPLIPNFKSQPPIHGHSRTPQLISRNDILFDNHTTLHLWSFYVKMLTVKNNSFACRVSFAHPFSQTPK
ncbi:hypothetical protein BJ878DRAFT_299922 [Calycina marina]|uniref:Uncharacterized protein n=1 Tax=Calycina marina TaxID=1763456 RepID=A0A9P8CB85_9HELO|nr:hypothetical protein BJ878DRAFT_299922 [Calycina marina]